MPPRVAVTWAAVTPPRVAVTWAAVTPPREGRPAPAARATATTATPRSGPGYEAAMDFLFDTYADALPRVRAWVDGRSRARTASRRRRGGGR